MSDFSIATYTASGAPNVQYAIPYGFISREHVLVFTGFNKETGAYDEELQPGVGFTWINDTTIQVPTLAGGTVLSIVRQTPSDQTLVDWVAGGGALTSKELRLSSLQVLYALQEATDRATASGIAADAALTLAERLEEDVGAIEDNIDVIEGDINSLQSGKVSKAGDTMTGPLAMSGQKVTGVGAPTASGDAATKGYTDAADALKANKAGDTMTGPLAMSGQKITALGDPVEAQDAATKRWVTGIAFGGVNLPDFHFDGGNATSVYGGTFLSIDGGNA